MRWPALALALVVLAAGCRGRAGATELTVAAAASLTEVSTALEPAFEAARTGVDVTFHFAGSSTLARQINNGSPADVFVAADEETMQTVVDAGNARAPEAIARSRMVLLVERGNPKGLNGLADLDDPDVLMVRCAPQVPCGRLASRLLAQAGLAGLEPASLEQNVKAVVAKVTLGEADAGLVYATDAKAAGSAVEGVELDGADDPALQAVYLASATTDSAHPRAARAWIDTLTSREGRTQLADAGFLLP